VERFIPQATAQPAPPTRREKPAGTADSGVHREPAAATKAATASKSTGDTTTRQKLAVRQRAAAAPKPGDRKAGDRMTATVIADAVRFLSWDVSGRSSPVRSHGSRTGRQRTKCAGSWSSIVPPSRHAPAAHRPDVHAMDLAACAALR